MKRRKFLGTSLAASALAATAVGAQEAAPAGEREFYQLRRYQLSRGPQIKLTNDYFRGALVPALNRMGMRPVGVFNESIGPGTPVMYVLIPGASVETLVTLDERLRKDDDYMKAAANFITAPGKEPPFEREESWLLKAFETHPKITLPAATASGGPRVFELRTYESPSLQDHWRKIEQMNSGESAIFTKAGMAQVFFGDVLIGSRQPCLTYMLCYNNLGERDPAWNAFLTAPEWKALSTDPKYAFEDIVTNITNVMLTPADYSQI
jgi:NIPSNAP